MINSDLPISSVSNILRKTFSAVSISMKSCAVSVLEAPGEEEQLFAHPEGEAADFKKMKIHLRACLVVLWAAAGNTPICRKKARMPNITYRFHWKNQYLARIKRY